MSPMLYQVDAFTGQLFRGNPAGVCLLEEEAQPEWMQAVANEMNLAETAFVSPQANGFNLRWFTPQVEVEMCGHATLASAHILWETGRLAPSESAKFHTLSGLLTCRENDGWIEMDFPTLDYLEIPSPAGLADALGARLLGAYRSKFDLLVELEDAAAIRSLQPDLLRLTTFPYRGIITTSRSDQPDCDFISRFFCPSIGINEDPVTGSSHCVLTPYWAKRLGKTELTAYQASRRGGTLRVKLRGDRVLLNGQAVTFFAAQIN